MNNLTSISDITMFDEGASLPNAIEEIEVAAVKEAGQPWGVYLKAWEEYAASPDLAKLFANALMFAALQAEMLNAGHPIEDALDLVENLTNRVSA